MSEPIAVVLAAGKGTRMKSDLPKVLAPAAGKPMIRYVVEALRAAGVGRIVVVVGYRAELVQSELADEPGVSFVEQTEQLGTGHAVMVCREEIERLAGGESCPVVIVTGDSPMLQVSSVEALLKEFRETGAVCLVGTTHKDDPTGLGRVVRDAAGEFLAIVEQKDATPEQQAVTEVNMSTYVFDSAALLTSLESLTTENAQREYYITDCPRILKDSGAQVRALAALKPCEALSVNTLDDLKAVEAEMAKQNTGQQ
ncbi:Bifunctional protein GlmU [Pseudobythopirellula maris]|uniref:Bifunctional protein GlmU n=1 Tax=Pseudobythopirellula maris TaxID=2527991 RepID=A0A5C5ZML6_9BACT|nr:NTP transferase domain-containing protein [Pseudobythopirellula maris]TWT88410.1 Bifunctional protein GlmU [Pseudobythopirellula maris]